MNPGMISDYIDKFHVLMGFMNKSTANMETLMCGNFVMTLLIIYHWQLSSRVTKYINR